MATDSGAWGTRVSVPDVPDAYVARDRRRALAAGVELPDRVRGAALFADISGFTPLAGALARELGPQRGPEELTACLNRVFHEVIEQLDRFGGDVIYFSGDALTCWLDGDDGGRAVACAFAMQDVMAEVGALTTPGGVEVRLGMKVAVAVGSARRFVVGDPELQLLDALAGQLVDHLAAAEQLARRGEVVLDESGLDLLANRVALGERRVDPLTGRTVAVVDAVVLRPAELPALVEVEPLAEELVRPWLLPDVYERLRTGHGEFLAELRPAVPLFLRFDGIDFDDDDEAAARLDDFVRRAQRVLVDHGGNLLQLTIGDKGANLYAVFGSPRSHEDDAARAVSAALELRALEGVTAARSLAIGVARGRLRSGTYGHSMRRTFVCLGDAVNLAARLMSTAPVGAIYAADTVREAAPDAFAWEALPPLTVKGKDQAVTAFAVRAPAARRGRELRHSGPMVGRAAELTALEGAFVATLATRSGRVVGVSGEAGMGKSRLVAELVGHARAGGVRTLLGECAAFGVNTSYLAWRGVWRPLFGLDGDLPGGDDARRVQEALAAVDPELLPRAPLLDVPLGIELEDTELTASFDAQLRKTSLEDLLVTFLRARTESEPLVIVIEDCHWLDPLSRDLLEAVARALPALPVLVVLAYRPEAGAREGLGLAALPGASEVALTALGDLEIAALIAVRLAAAPGEGPSALQELVTARAQGNPFYAEELVNYVRHQGIDPGDERTLRALDLPDSLRSLILSRVDTLDERMRRTLKVASVVGRVFSARDLPGVYPDVGSLDEVRGHLRALSDHDLVQLERPADEAYAFKHIVTQEAAYESMPFALRAVLHVCAGSYLEASEPDGDRNVDLLAHHFWLGDDEERKRHYLQRAGEAAQSSFANAAAIDYFERLAPLLDGVARAQVLLRLGDVLALVGDWDRAEAVTTEALELSASLGASSSEGWSETALAEIARKHGRYDDATAHLEQARACFEAAGEDDGLGRVLHLAGTVAAQQGDFAGARERYEGSLEIRERVGDAAGIGALYSNLGVVAEYDGDLDAARDFNERALAVRQTIGDRRGIGVSMNNLGTIALLQERYADADMHFRESMRLNREVGDAWMVAVCHNNLGNAARGLGDRARARASFAASLEAYRDYDDRWALAFLLEDIGALAADDGAAVRALELAGAADALRDAIGAARSPALQEGLDARLRPAVESLGAEAAAAARARGREYDLNETVEMAQQFCTG